MRKSRLALALVALLIAVDAYGQRSPAQDRRKAAAGPAAQKSPLPDRSPRSYLSTLKPALREKAQALLDQKDDPARARRAADIDFADPGATFTSTRKFNRSLSDLLLRILT